MRITEATETRWKIEALEPAEHRKATPPSKIRVRKRTRPNSRKRRKRMDAVERNRVSLIAGGHATLTRDEVREIVSPTRHEFPAVTYVNSKRWARYKGGSARRLATMTHEGRVQQKARKVNWFRRIVSRARRG